MVMPDCSLVVTTFSRHSWLLQRIATRVTSMVTLVDEEYLVSSAHLVHVPQRNRHGRFTLYVVPSSTSLRIPKDKDRRTIEQGQNWLCLKDVSRGEQNHSNESHRGDGKRAAIRLPGFFGARRTNPYMFIFVHDCSMFKVSAEDYLR
jgi:hypothetical protein